MTRKEYFKFFNVLTELIRLFMVVQQGCEELYISGELEFDDDLGGD